MTDYYQILGVSRRADGNTIKRAYRKQAHLHHPDKGGDKAVFLRIKEAYETLGDDNKRFYYDQSLRAQKVGAKLASAWGQLKTKLDIDKKPMLLIDLAWGYHGGARTVRYMGRDFSINLPKGAQNGQVIECDGVRFLVQYHAPDDVRVKGLDVYLPLRVSPWTAYFGGTAMLDTPIGQKKVRIPPNTPSGAKLKLARLGLDTGARCGDIIACVQLYLPPLNRAQIDALKIMQNQDPSC